ncbi:diaminopimelate epimerase [Secundilactobacillus kimchicus]|uniref:diaminopimelate epimerase n=1 Tax=Secundilactobacillus kimchicus TaxID=528209 RepID=UPI001C02C2F2|nr:diaminopimelate epimerase [Secundilactobacillus kimchicus]MBT9672135.1 diaminopimelate epimerase [Secundilactobacillus kimchicus]
MVVLHKVHGSQNRFFLLDQTTLEQPLTDPELVALAQQMTHPKTGLLNGADGILVVNASNHDNVLGQMRVINADGSEASMCGNGLRTVSRYLAEKYHSNQFKVETLTADLQVSRQSDLATDVPAFSVEISPVRFNQTAFPFDHLGGETLIDAPVRAFADGLTFTAIAVPNPHLISFVDTTTMNGPLLGDLGARLNRPNRYFPDGVNVSFAQILGPDQLFVRTFERGVGFTNACGTGMSATSLAFAMTHPQLGHFGRQMTIYNPGGMVKTVVHHSEARDTIELIGNATETHLITVDEAQLHQANVTEATATVATTHEEAAYEAFVAGLPSVSAIAVKE